MNPIPVVPEPICVDGGGSVVSCDGLAIDALSVSWVADLADNLNAGANVVAALLVVIAIGMGVTVGFFLAGGGR